MPTLEEFLTITAGTKEIGLIIAKDASELAFLTRSLDERGFKQSKIVASLLDLQGCYFLLNEFVAKDAYDFAVQYPSGQVEIFDKSQMQSHSYSPNYSSLNPIFLVIKEDLHKLQAKGFDLLSVVGPAFQT